MTMLGVPSHVTGTATFSALPGHSDWADQAEQDPAQVAAVKRSLPSPASWRKASPRSYRYVCDKQCPSCGGRLIRMRRRLQDRLWSLVVPSMRCRCDRFTCQWIGNLPLRPVRGAALVKSWIEPGSSRRALVFACAGMLALTLFAARGPFA